MTGRDLVRIVLVASVISIALTGTLGVSPTSAAASGLFHGPRAGAGGTIGAPIARVVPAVAAATGASAPDPLSALTLLAGRSGSYGPSGSVQVNFSVTAPGTEVVYIWSAGGGTAVGLPEGLSVIASFEQPAVDPQACCSSAGIAVGLLPVGNYTSQVNNTFGTPFALSIAVYGIAGGADYVLLPSSANESHSLGAVPGAVLYLGALTTGGFYPVNNGTLSQVDEQSPALYGGLTEMIGFQNSSTFSFESAAIAYGIVAVGLYPAETFFPVTFSASGLPAGAGWSVNITGWPLLDSSTPTLTTELLNGSYSFVAASVAGIPPTSGTFVVNGTAVDVAVPFPSGFFRITFDESGLYPGTDWSVQVGGGPTVSSTSTEATLALENGTYGFAATTASAAFTTPNGSVQVTGADLQVDLVFVPHVYPVTFNETGLPPGEFWYVATVPVGFGQSATSSITVLLRNGSYSYSAGSYNGSFTMPAGGFAVNGSAVSVPVAFEAVEILVTFQETGLPVGTTWWVNVTDGPNLTWNGSTLLADFPNGTYAFAVGVSYVGASAFSASTGNFTVAGSAVIVPVDFVKVQAVTFTEHGLPSGARWWVALSAFAPRSTATGAELRLWLPRGTFGFTAGAGQHAFSAKPGVLTVRAQPKREQLKFSATTYTVQFLESGLPAGTRWCLELHGGKRSCSAKAVRTVVEPVGAYPFTASTPTRGYSAPSGVVFVNGSLVVVQVSFGKVGADPTVPTLGEGSPGAMAPTRPGLAL